MLTICIVILKGGMPVLELIQSPKTTPKALRESIC